MTDTKNTSSANTWRIVLIGLLLALAIFGAYRYYISSGENAQAASAGGGAAVTGGSGQTSGATGAPVNTPAAAAGGAGCACGGGAASSTQTQGTAALSGDVQTITVNVGSSGYDPNVITLKAGVPAEITFTQSQGCTGYVQSQDLGFQADLTAGPQTVKLPALQPGTYGFACGMNMVTGQIVVA